MYHDLPWLFRDFLDICLLNIEDQTNIYIYFPVIFPHNFPVIFPHPIRWSREVGIHDEDQPFWDAVFPASETREVTMAAGVTGSTWSIPLKELVIYPIN